MATGPHTLNLAELQTKAFMISDILEWVFSMNKNNDACFFVKSLSSSQDLEIIMNHRRAKHNVMSKVYSDLFSSFDPCIYFAI